MVLTRIRPIDFVLDKNQVYNLTHFICIPLVTSSSRPLLQQSLSVLRESRASAGIPPAAFVPPDMLQINLRIPMSLSTPSRFANAKKLLESLDLNSLTRELVKPSGRERSISEQFLELEKSLSLSPVANMTQPLPLHVTLSSLVGSSLNDQKNRVNGLGALCHDPTSRVRHLCNNLAIIFAGAGMFNQPSLRSSPTTKLLLHTKLKGSEVPLPEVVLITMSSLPGKPVPSPIHPGKFKIARPSFDPRELTRTFKDFVWAENIRLDRLSICPLGIAKQLRKASPDAQLPEACSVPL